MANRNRPITHKGFTARISHRTLYINATDRVRPIEDVDRLVCLSRRLKEIAESGFVGVEPCSDILDVVNDRIQIGKLLRCRPSFSIRIAVNTVDRKPVQASRESPIAIVSSAPAIPCSGLKIAFRAMPGACASTSAVRWPWTSSPV